MQETPPHTKQHNQKHLKNALFIFSFFGGWGGVLATWKTETGKNLEKKRKTKKKRTRHKQLLSPPK